jgi:hypothetical protein
MQDEEPQPQGEAMPMPGPQMPDMGMPLDQMPGGLPIDPQLAGM